MVNFHKCATGLFFFVESACPPWDCEDTVLIIYKRTLDIFTSGLNNFTRQLPIKHERKQI